VDAVLRGESGSLRVQHKGVDTLVAFAPVATYGMGVLISESVETAFAPARRQAWLRGSALASLVLVVLLLAWIVGGRLAAMYEDLQRALGTRDDFLASASHDLRNPLSAIQGAGETLARSLELTGEVPPERLQACIAHIRSASRRMAKLLDGFLDVAQLQLGRPLELDKQRADVKALLQGALDEAREAAPRHRFELETPDELYAQIDEPRIHRVLGNLLGNAVKYSPAGSVVRVKAASGGGNITVSVQDNGIGIADVDQQRIFERFQRGTNATGRFAGTGIGLSGARQVIEQHGGRISVASSLGHGATFTIQFPRGEV
jgi:signal transduction histidine kinase